MLPAVLLSILPGVSAAEVPVTVAVELPPRVLAALRVCRGTRDWGREGKENETDNDQSVENQFGEEMQGFF